MIAWLYWARPLCFWPHWKFTCLKWDFGKRHSTSLCKFAGQTLGSSRICRINPRSLLEKIVTRSLEGGGGSIGPPSTFDTIHPIDLKIGTYNKLRLYFQLSETTWSLIGFHGDNSQINDVTGSRHLGFSNFQILFKLSLFYLRLTRKQYLAVEIHEIGRIHCEVVSN